MPWALAVWAGNGPARAALRAVRACSTSRAFAATSSLRRVDLQSAAGLHGGCLRALVMHPFIKASDRSPQGDRSTITG